MIISPKNLECGIQWWNYNTQWGREFVNDEYYDIYNDRKSGITEDWLERTVDRLWAWKAIRSPRPPNSKAEIALRGRRQLSSIATACQRLSGKASTEPTIEDVTWEDISALYELVLPIKCVSHMFASKMCHFLFPKIFMVVDNLATGVIEYEFYWRGMKDEWVRCTEKENVKKIFTSAMESKMKIHQDYPFETKIIELSQIGYTQRDHRTDFNLLSSEN